MDPPRSARRASLREGGREKASEGHPNRGWPPMTVTWELGGRPIRERRGATQLSVTSRQEVVIKLRSKQRERLRQFYAGRAEDRKPLCRALELPDTQNIYMKLTQIQVTDLLMQVEDDYEQVTGTGGEEGLLLRHGMFTLRNTLALVDRYGITGDEL